MGIRVSVGKNLIHLIDGLKVIGMHPKENKGITLHDFCNIKRRAGRESEEFFFGREKIFFKKGRGVILKKIEIAPPAAEKIKNKNKNIVYEPSYGQVTIKNIDKNIDLGLVIKSLDDIIGQI